jgi:acid phosphatase type 7
MGRSAVHQLVEVGRRVRRTLPLIALGLVVSCLAIAPGSVTVSGASATDDPVIAAAGDISCDPANSGFKGGAGVATRCRQRYTSDLLVGANLAAVLDLGDNQYECGSLTAYNQAYEPTWGRVKAITRPVAGNHEYLTSASNSTGCDASNAGAAGYFNYFGAAAGTRGQGWYSYDIGAWHFIALNSQCSAVGGCGSSSPQYRWLQADLASHSNLCTLAYWHVPLFSSGGRAASNSQSWWRLLYEANADVVLVGHDHIYERFAPQDPNASADPARGIRQFTVGTGGGNHTAVTTVAANSQARDSTTFGVLKLTLHPGGYDWQFVPAAGTGTFTDSGSAPCHGSVADTTPPSAPGNLTASPAGPGEIDLGWTASTDDVAVSGYRIYRDGGASAIATVTGTSYADRGVGPNTTHSYTVTAFDAAGNESPGSNTATATTPPDTSPPSAPTGLTATAINPNQVALTWGAATDDDAVAGYRVLRNGAQVGTTASTSFTDSGLQPATTYTYAIVAYDGSGNVSAASNTATATTPASGTVVFADGFESGTMGSWSSNTGIAIQQLDVYAGVWAARMTSTGAQTWAYEQLPATYTDIAYSLAVKVASQGANSLNLLKFRTATGTAIGGVYLSSTGALAVRNDVSAVSTSSQTVVSRGVWHTIKMHVIIGGAAGSLTEVWLDGARVAALTTGNSLGTTPVGRVQLGENSTGRTYDVAFDNVEVTTP